MNAPRPLLWERWEEVDRLLQGALEESPDAREAWIQQATGGDAELAALVSRLVTHSEATGRRADTPPEALLQEAFGEEGDPALAEGTTVGRWVVRGPRARGGMATVYEAERADGAYEQRVALKVLRRGLDTDDLIARFRTERQILSSLTHPNIARLLDGGSTGDGRPFLVMELVEGMPITAWAEARRLGVRERLDLFLGVADAVHAAHRQLVVHRDIKPSNVLVDPEGRVRLLDFGIAKLLEGEPEVTRTGLRALTPEYASPEQLREEPVTTASDVYQLGLLLHELLTGARPVRGEAARPSRMARLQGHPERVAALRGDLDLIVGTALREVPEERYASADELAADVRRHLRRLPIQAHPESAAYRLRTFLRRHPLVLPVASVVILGVAAFIAALTVQNQRLEHERDAARLATQRSGQVQAFVLDLLRSPDPFGTPDPEQGRAITVVDALQRGATRVDTEYGDDPLLSASLLEAMGGVLTQLAQYADARTLLEEAARLRLVAGDTTSPEWSQTLDQLVVSMVGLSIHDSADVLAQRRMALERGREPPVPELLAGALRTMATTVQDSSPDAAIALLEEAVDVLEPLGGRDHAVSLKALSDLYRGQHRMPEAEAAGRAAYAALDSLLGPDHPTTVMAEHALGQTLGVRGQYDEAAGLLARSLQVLERQLGPEHPYALSMRGNVAALYLNAARPADAEVIYGELVAIQRRARGERHVTVAQAMQNHAATLLELGRLSEAEALTWEVEAIFRETLAPGAVQMALPMLTRTEIQLAAGRYADARRTVLAAAAILEPKLPPLHPARIMADCRLGRALTGLGRLAEARPLLESANERLRTAEGVRDSHRQECEAALAALVT